MSDATSTDKPKILVTKAGKLSAYALAEKQRLSEQLEEARSAFEAAVSEANDFLDAVAPELRAYYEERSEQWQEGDAGNAYDAWVTEFEQVIDAPALDEFMLDRCTDEPE